MTTIDSGTNKLFPVFLKMETLHILIVGGGKIALEKVTSVLSNSPATRVLLVAPEILPELFLLKNEYPSFVIKQREYETSDLDQVDLLISATGNRVFGERIRKDAQDRRLLVNIADTPELCDFYLGAIVSKGDLKIAISTNGKSPTIAKRFKEVLNDAFPGEIQEVLENLSTIRTSLKGDMAEKVKQLNAITSVLVMKKTEPGKHILKRIRIAVAYSCVVLFLMILGHILFAYMTEANLRNLAENIYRNLDKHLFLYIAGGFVAQMIDGALGMAYGVSVTTFLLSLGLPVITPAVASASMHASEIFTTGSSSLVYMRYKNVNMKLFRKLVLPGAIGAVAGAMAISFISKEWIQIVKPLVALYTLSLGLIIIFRAVKISSRKAKKIRRIVPVAAAGGFLDSVGGGGWGPIVTTSLIAGGRNLRYAVGSSHLAKFFVAIISTITFICLIGLQQWQIMFGLIIGSMIAAPISIYFSNKIPIKGGLILVGVVVILVSLRILILTFIR
jgi:siroheme synthase-like protein